MMTSSEPIQAARVPLSIESWPRPGPTVRSSMMVSGAGSAPARSRMARSFACCDGEAAGNLAGAAEDRLADHRRRDHLVVEHDREGPPDILLRRLREAARAVGVEAEGDDRLAGALVEAGLRVGQVLAGHHDALLDQIGLAVFGACEPGRISDSGGSLAWLSGGVD